jgi:formiminotetrahydrofolate cyclodeaminase
MVVAYSVNKKDLAPHHATLKDAALRLERARTLFLTLADEDAAAYGLLNHLERLPDTDPTRLRDEPAAKQAATDIPLAAAAAAEELARLLDTLPTITNPHLKSDLAVAAHLALAAARAAGCNVRINLPLLEPAPRAAAEALIASLLDRAAAFATNVERACA